MEMVKLILGQPEARTLILLNLTTGSGKKQIYQPTTDSI